MAKAVEIASLKQIMINNGVAPGPSHNEAMLYGASTEGNLVLYLAADHRQRKPRIHNALQALSRLVSHRQTISPV